MDLFSLLRPALFRLDPETAHDVAIWALSNGLVPPPSRSEPDPILKTRHWGRVFTTPVGLAAGFDKNAQAVDALLAQGFGFVEVGSVTPRPQPGNPKPRLFRLQQDQAVINRMGFNNQGIAVVADRLAHRKKQNAHAGPVGVNLGRNKTTEEAARDYEAGVISLGPLADYLVVNVSSPNTPGLRDLQGRDALQTLLTRVLAARNGFAPGVPVLLKVAPDLTEEDKSDIAHVALQTGIDGIIISNTTLARPDHLISADRRETGGLSGAPLLNTATRMLRDFYRLTEARLPLIGVGGISSGAGAYARIRAGASLVQLYSALVYHGPGLARRIADDLAVLLREDGYTTLQAAIGADHRG